MAITPEEFVARLQSIAESNGVPFGRLPLLHQAEQAHALAVLNYKGYVALSDTFKCFFLETVEQINANIRPRVTAPLSEFYPIFVARLTHAFQSLCGAERLALSGYPYQAYTTLRNTYDNVLMGSAAVQGFTDFYRLEGVVPDQPLDMVAVKRLRKKTEFEVQDIMVGVKSALSADTLTELKRWDDLFDFEVHGGRLSLAGSMDWMKGQGPLPVVPRFEESQFAMYLNRYCEIAWMVHRMIPLFQPPGLLIRAPWPEKWRVLDESFEATVHSLTQQFGKKIGAAIVELVKVKFPFSDFSTYPLG
jgi:hypothetical protein